MFHVANKFHFARPAGCILAVLITLGHSKTALAACFSGQSVGSIEIGTAASGGGCNAVASAANTIAIGGNSNSTQNAAVAIGANSNAVAVDSVAIGSGSVANVANTVSVGTVGGERKIVNLAAGTLSATSTDAVNGSQLFSANQRVAAAFGGGAGLDANGQLNAPTYTIQGTNFNNIGGALNALNTAVMFNNGGSPYYKSNSTGPAASATGTDALAMGSSATASGANAIAAGTGAQATAANSTAIGPGATATHANAVAIGSGSVTSAANTVSVGAAGSERRITNVASGIGPTDAVNVGQISSITSGFQSQISGLQSQIYDNRTEARRGVAAAVATASAPMPSAPGKTTWQIRGSTFQSEFGAGFGFAHRLYTATPLNIVGGYGNGGGVQHTGYVGLGGEF
jgi:autotransporter adhesin